MKSLEEELESLRSDMEERVQKVRDSFRNDIVPVPRGEVVLKRASDPFRKLRSRP